jgi:hypothetical protein
MFLLAMHALPPQSPFHGIIDIGIVPPGTPVPKNGNLPALMNGTGEMVDGHLGPLPGPIHGEVTEARHIHPIKVMVGVAKKFTHHATGFVQFVHLADKVFEVPFVVHDHHFHKEGSVIPELSGQRHHLLGNLRVDFMGHGGGSYDSLLPGFTDLGHLGSHEKIDLLADAA